MPDPDDLDLFTPDDEPSPAPPPATKRRVPLKDVKRKQAGPGLDPDHPDAEKEPTPARPGFVPALEVMKEPPAPCIVERIGPAGGILLVAGESGIGKSFIVDGLAACIVDGRTWFGLSTQRGSVAKMSFEGDATSLRLQALHEYGYTLEDLYVLRATDPISPRLLREGLEAPSIGEVHVTEDLARLSDDLRRRGRPPITAIVIDTVRASMTGSEDDSGPVTSYLRVVRRILATVPGALAILVHHSGWLDGETKRKRERGSSAWRGNVDATVYIEADEDGAGQASILIRCLKARDAERPALIRAIRQRVTVQRLDDHGEPLSSCVVVQDTSTKEDREAAASAAKAAADRALDLRILRIVRDDPTAHNNAHIRSRASAAKKAVDEAMGRLLAGRLLTEGKRGQPFILTEAGAQLVGPAEVTK